MKSPPLVPHIATHFLLFLLLHPLPNLSATALRKHMPPLSVLAEQNHAEQVACFVVVKAAAKSMQKDSYVLLLNRRHTVQ